MEVRVELNTDQITAFIQNSDGIEKTLKKAADWVEAEMPEAVEEGKALFEQRDHKFTAPPYEQEVFSRKGELTDRQRWLVGIEKAHFSDFIFNTPARATEKAGGVR